MASKFKRTYYGVICKGEGQRYLQTVTDRRKKALEVSAQTVDTVGVRFERVQACTLDEAQAHFVKRVESLNAGVQA